VIVRTITWGIVTFGVAGALLIANGTAHAQSAFPASTGNTYSSGSSFSQSSPGNTGSSGGNRGTNNSSAFGNTGSRTGSGSNSYGTTSFLGSFYAMPLAFGLPTSANLTSQLNTVGGTSGSNLTSSLSSSSSGRSGGSSGATTSGLNNSSMNMGITNQNKTASVPFGQVLYNLSTNSTRTTGTTLRTTTAQFQNTQARPTFAAQVGFKPGTISAAQVTADFQRSIAGSEELSKPGNKVELVIDGDVAVLRGTVQNPFERDLAQTLAVMTPGVYAVKNDLTVREATGESSGSH
jgi:hypothetical protein